jgi:hypothetical protein
MTVFIKNLNHFAILLKEYYKIYGEYLAPNINWTYIIPINDLNNALLIELDKFGYIQSSYIMKLFVEYPFYNEVVMNSDICDKYTAEYFDSTIMSYNLCNDYNYNIYAHVYIKKYIRCLLLQESITNDLINIILEYLTQNDTVELQTVLYRIVLSYDLR